MTTRVTLLAAVTEQRLPSLRGALGVLPLGSDGPFASVPGTHYARWVLLTRLGPPLLLFSAVTDVSARPYLQSMVENLPPEAQVVWEHCDGWPHQASVEEKTAWLEARCYRPHLTFATVEATVQDIVAGIDARRRLGAFAAANQGLEPAALQKAFRAEFGP